VVDALSVQERRREPAQSLVGRPFERRRTRRAVSGARGYVVLVTHRNPRFLEILASQKFDVPSRFCFARVEISVGIGGSTLADPSGERKREYPR
jgi:hypothetical protein